MYGVSRTQKHHNAVKLLEKTEVVPGSPRWTSKLIVES